MYFVHLTLYTLVEHAIRMPFGTVTFFLRFFRGRPAGLRRPRIACNVSPG